MSPRTDSPALALSLGEPAGIGPEITAAAWQTLHHERGLAFFLIGDAALLRARAPTLPVEEITTAAAAAEVFARALPVLHQPLAASALPGKLDAANAPCVIRAIDTGVALVLAGQASGLVTNPIQKETLYQAGFRHQGHTDYLAHLAVAAGHKAEPVMMLAAPGLRTVPVTVHIALKDVPGALSQDLIIRQAVACAQGLSRWFGLQRPRIGITGLNPHAGENGTMGTEEITIIGPAIAQLAARGLDVTGPLSADTLFHEEARSAFDVILCMYHDQALIPVKTLGFHEGVNCTLGLPFIRTSPDHGTALSLAGTGKANPLSLISAIRMAAGMARNDIS
ncbi:MAG: 4-hydroxythreonine-4-phosphate dehydrogenase PdxA [Aestuariivirgaceae bacterium]|nr:4-hydroxythreonine-4-phosphate dehydrogenase PdxA [Aestuariivirgaceae bacterium]